MKIPSETSGLVESILSALLFWIPNILLLVFPLSKSTSFFITAYNYVMFFVLLSTIAMVKFRG